MPRFASEMPTAADDAAHAHAAVLVRVRAEAEDLAVGLLWEAGTEGVEVRSVDSGDVALIAYFAPHDGLLDDLRAALAPAAPQALESVPVQAVDWVARFREGFRAFEAAGFQIVPDWEADAAAPTAGTPRRIVVDPGRAFGTGTHETTRLCLSLLADLAQRRALPRVVDVGCGTGILAVAARKLGARHVVAVDFDPEATHSARVHARLNTVALHVVQADGGRALAPGRFDLVLANLMAPLLLARRDELGALAAPGGVLVLSGLLVDDVAEVRAAYAPLGRIEEHRDGEWAALLVERP